MRISVFIKPTVHFIFIIKRGKRKISQLPFEDVSLPYTAYIKLLNFTFLGMCEQFEVHIIFT